VSTTPGIDVVLDLLMRIASGEEGARAEPPGQDPAIDAMVVGLTMLAEELDDERRRRTAAEALLDDERDAYARSPGLLCSIDAATLSVVKCNDTLARAIGVAPDELVGRPVATLFRDNDQELAGRVLSAAAAGSPSVIPELHLRGTTGELRVTTAFSRTETPSPRLRVVWTDVTHERLLEGHLLQAQKMQAVGRLSGGVAHDFNNILAIILASVSLLREGVGSSSDGDLDVLEQAARRGADLTGQLLAFSRQHVAQPKRLELGGLVRDVDRMLRRLIPEGIAVSILVPDASLFVTADPTQISQVLVNLVVNARDAVSERGRILIEVERVALDEAYASDHFEVAPGSYALVSVSDDGSGMPADVLAQAFEPFFTTKPPGEGTGLGLSVCYGIVRQAGGHILLYSEPGQGTTVKVYLPLSAQDPAPQPSAAKAPVAAAAREVVLLVEDEAALRKLTARLLERAGYEVVTAANGQEALELMSHRAPVDIVVTDVVMPKVGGRALVDQLMREGKTRAALYVSGYTANSIAHHGVLAEDVHFLAKPFTTDQLLRALRAALGGE
jgi:signal transduction histidine kinase/ActR/RegA family two-component response regulator